jgi:serine protease Do
MRRLPRIVAETEVGKTVEIEVWRNSKKVTLEAKIEELDDSGTEVAAKTSGPKTGKESTVDELGLRLSPMTAKVKGKYSLDKDAKGVVVTKVDENGPAAEKGIRPGDVIVEISQTEVARPADIAKKVAEAKKAGRKSVLLLLEGQGGLRFVAIRITKS